MNTIGALVEQLISIKDGLKEDLYDSQINALNDACNLIYYAFDSDKDVQSCIKSAKHARKDGKQYDNSLQQETLLYQMLKKHAGHRVEIAEYGDGINFALEDMDTNEVIFDTDIYNLTGREKG